jgi:hypothetical protein
MSRFASTLVVLASVSLLVLTGCGAATSYSNPTASAKMGGKIFGGQQPVSGATVDVWAAGVTGYGSAATRLARTISGPDGTFSFPESAYTCKAGEQVYITASGGNAAPGYVNPNIMLATGLGDCTAAHSEVVEINEVTTVATAFALAQFFTPTLGLASNDDFGTAAAGLGAFTLSNESTIPTLIDLPTGTVKPNAAGVTIEAAKIYSIANILAACVNDAADFSNCGTLFADTTVNGGTTPTDTLQAAVQMARYPSMNVAGLYALAGSKPPFPAQLATAPKDWTIGVSYTSSNFALSIAGSSPSGGSTSTSASSATIDIDSFGNVWFPTNLPGHTGIAEFSPGSNTFSGPYVTGVLTQPQYLAIDANGIAYATDLASNVLAYQDTGNTGGASSFGHLVVEGYATLGPIAGVQSGDVYFTGGDGSGRNFTFHEFDLQTPANYGVELTYSPTGMIAGSDFVLLSTSGSGTPCALEIASDNRNGVYIETANQCTSGGIAFAAGGLDQVGLASSLDELCSPGLNCGVNPYPGNLNLPEGIATDGYGQEWVANAGNASVFPFGPFDGSGGYATISAVDYVHDTANGNTMTTPYAIAIDGSGNVWVANAGCVTLSSSCTPGAFVLSELIGAAGPTITPLSLQMVGDGGLVGSLPGAPAPLSSAHPDRLGTNVRGGSIATSNLKR